MRRSLLLLILFLLQGGVSIGQMPTCSPGIVYLHVGTEIWNFDQNSPFVPGINPSLNSISCPPNAMGLAIGPNINSSGPSPTFYTTVNSNYHYYDGSGWVNTNHYTGAAWAVNIGAGGGFIYNLSMGASSVYKYDGAGNGTLLFSVAPAGGPLDLCVDTDGNFYFLELNLPTQLRKYNPNGVLIHTWTITGAPSNTAGGGFAIICDSLYFSTAFGTYKGFIDNSTNNITITTFGPFLGTTLIEDYASCPAEAGSGFASIDTGYYCGTGPGVPISALGSGLVTWSVISGNAVISGAGPNITVTATSGISKILLRFNGNGICSQATDTVTIIVPSAIIDAGISPDTITGCASFIDTLHATVVNTTPGLTYSYSWTPAAAIAAGSTTLSPTVTPSINTTFYFTVTTPANQGGCQWTDSVLRIVDDHSVTTDYSYQIQYGCATDTVYFQNLSSGATNYYWNFNDGTIDTATHAVHVYSTQGSFNVQLIAANETCADTVVKVVDTRHPLIASFTPNNDTICEGISMTFTSTSTYSQQGGPAKFAWYFGDGTNDTVANPTHVFTTPGVYYIVLVVTDFIGCSDTALGIMIVDSLPAVRFAISDSILCEGQNVVFLPEYSVAGNTGSAWDFGDGNIMSSQGQIEHAYDTSGVYTVSLTGIYRACPSVSYTSVIDVRPFPTLELGADTSMCPNGPVLIIGDGKNAADPLMRWWWNTGDTTAFIAVRHHGVYTASVSREGCETSDSVEVFKDCYLNIPNIFSPNGDGVNDYFLPLQFLSSGLTKYSMAIFNRWGQELFRTDRIDGRGWDGKFNGQEQPGGVYVYLIDAVLKSGQRERYEGNVTLVR